MGGVITIEHLASVPFDVISHKIHHRSTGEHGKESRQDASEDSDWIARSVRPKPTNLSRQARAQRPSTPLTAARNKAAAAGLFMSQRDRKTALKGKERKNRDNPREGWEDGTPPPHRDFKERGVVR